jgi:hypothetical protein
VKECDELTELIENEMTALGDKNCGQSQNRYWKRSK